ncbi:DsbA family protein [Roseomonas sp. JC162]|uniref:DsbA family protein n=1 Tax=Neoroseomonas marina TaxID=1232220 RepID=A0A848EGR2_9PROT|nr:DsbA family protein [Neoroseomonas marina]NMJ42637.1 DsbA family protein [Neoroseomonas marina]
MRRGFLLAAAGVMFGGRAMAQSFSDAQRAEIVDIIRDALRRDPTILREAFSAIQAAEERERAEAQRSGIVAQRAALFETPGDPIRGNPRGDVTIVEFFDVRCPYCKRLHGEMAEVLRRDRNLRIIMKDLPILGPQSVVGARALLAAQRQGKYPEFYDALMRLRGEPTDEAIRAEAQRIGLDANRLFRDMQDAAIQQRLDTNIALARRLQIEGTPALVIGDTLIPGALPASQIERLVQAERERRR